MRILVLLALITSSISLSVQASQKTINMARQMILKKDRVGAVNLLMKELEKDPSKTKLRTELLKEIDRLSKVFLTESGQKNFELAETILYAAKPGAAEKYEEALAIEDQNTEVLLGLARARLAEGSCQAAVTAITQAEKINPFSPEKKILKIKAEICLKQSALVLENDSAFKDALKTEYRLVQTEVFFNQRKLKEAEGSLKNITDEKMPEVAYWNFKVREERPVEASPFAEKYLDLCKGVSAVQRREYKLEPQLCKKTEEADSYLKKNEASK